MIKATVISLESSANADVGCMGTRHYYDIMIYSKMGCWGIILLGLYLSLLPSRSAFRIAIQYNAFIQVLCLSTIPPSAVYCPGRMHFAVFFDP